MFVFWWQGKGFFTVLIVVAAAIVTGIIADALHLPSYTPWFWTIALLVAAPFNWVVGRRYNYRRRKTLGPISAWTQLTYRARHKFMSLPMETWSPIMLIAATILAISAVARS